MFLVCVSDLFGLCVVRNGCLIRVVIFEEGRFSLLIRYYGWFVWHSV